MCLLVSFRGTISIFNKQHISWHNPFFVFVNIFDDAIRVLNTFFSCSFKFVHTILSFYCGFVIGSPTNQMAGFLTNEMAESSVHQPIRSQEKEPIRKLDTERNNQSTPSIQSLHSMKSRDSHFIRHVTQREENQRSDQSIEHSVHPDPRGSGTGSLNNNFRQRPDPR